MLTDILAATRRSKGLSRTALAATAGVQPQVIKRLESGVGSLPTLIAVMKLLELRLSGIARGHDLASQLQQRRINIGLTHEQVAKRAGISRNTVAMVEGGKGSMRSAVRLLDTLAPKARLREPVRAHWSPDIDGGRDVQFTPPELLGAIYEAFGPIDLDPCAHEASPVRAKRRILLSKGQDGLLDEWSGRLAYMNPPFSALLKWLRRADEQWRLGKVATVVALAPARMDSAWFHDHLRHVADIYVLKGRMRFLTLTGKGHQTPFTMMVVTWGASSQQKERWSELVPGFWL